MPKSITDPTYVGSKAYVNYIKVLKKKYKENKIWNSIHKYAQLGSSQSDYLF